MERPTRVFAMDILLSFTDAVDTIIRNYHAFFPESLIYALPASIRRNHTLITFLFGMGYVIYGLVSIALTDTIEESAIKDFRRAIRALCFGTAVIVLSPIGFELGAICLALLLLYVAYRVVRGFRLNLIAIRKFRTAAEPKMDDPGIS